MIKKILAVFMAFLIFSTPVLAKEEVLYPEYKYLDRLFSYAAELYIDESVTKEDILKQAIKKYLTEHPEAVEEILKSGFESLDEYSEYYTYNEFNDFVNNLNHTFYGIGVVIQQQEDYIVISSVLEDGSAFEKGMKPGDKISKVNGVDMRGKSIDEVQSAIVGELGTMVNVTVLRNGAEITFELERRPVDQTTVDYTRLKNDIAYVSIINFAQNTDEEFKNILSQIDKDGITKIILDLRNNPGGYLDSAINIAKLTVPAGVIVSTVYRQSEKNEVIYSNLQKAKYEFAVLVNENTASASEVLTSALQDSGVGVVIGETTYGKAVIQDIYNMTNLDAFKITTGRYITRNGKEINKKGIEPDEYVINTTEKIDASRYPKINFYENSSFADESENIAIIKERLQIIGYHDIFGGRIFDAGLESAVLDFQLKNGLEPTGALDNLTMVKIENEFAKSEIMVDNQFNYAYSMFGGKIE